MISPQAADDDAQAAAQEEKGQAIYKLRSQTVKPVFGQIKASWGVRTFSAVGRGRAVGIVADLRMFQPSQAVNDGLWGPMNRKRSMKTN